jgi:hypothetical protein
MALVLTSIDYRKLTISLCRFRRDHAIQGSVDQFAYRPDMIRDEAYAADWREMFGAATAGYGRPS